MGISMPRLPEQSVEDIMNETPDVRNKDCIKIHKRWIMNGQGKLKELFEKTEELRQERFRKKKKLHMIQYIKIFSSEWNFSVYSR